MRPLIISRRAFAKLFGGAFGAVALGSSPLLSCVSTGAGEACSGDDNSLIRPEGWTIATHCSKTDPDYATLFRDDIVHRFDIEIDPSDYELTMEDMSAVASTGAMGGGVADVDEPIYVPVTIRFNGYTWLQVGMRYKGNSSLVGTWNAGIRKLSFRLSFDKYEDDNPDLDDQRFYGFKKMTFSSGFNDPSLIRDKVAGDIFRDGGVPAARSAFARVYFDVGEGPVYWGLYTMIEDPSDAMLESEQLPGDGSGNLYKPEGVGADWTVFDIDGFPKKTNELEDDYNDIIAAIAALNSDRSNEDEWRAGLEATFDVEGFLRFLAINQVMVNWDSYGCMAHNYYLYGNPEEQGRLLWFPWDLNESLISTRRACDTAESVLLCEVTSEWPLIRFLLDDATYAQRYREEVQAALDGAFSESSLLERMYAYHEMISPYVIGDDGESGSYTHLRSDREFEESIDGVDGLAAHVATRRADVAEALEEEIYT